MGWVYRVIGSFLLKFGFDFDFGRGLEIVSWETGLGFERLGRVFYIVFFFIVLVFGSF